MDHIRGILDPALFDSFFRGEAVNRFDPFMGQGPGERRHHDLRAEFTHLVDDLAGRYGGFGGPLSYGICRLYGAFGESVGC